MLELKVDSGELFDEETETFVPVPETVLTLEHSLISVSKWEEVYKKPFLSREDKTREELVFYIRCMTVLPKKVSESVYANLSDSDISKVFDYVKEERNATTINRREKPKPTREQITAELLYYYMFANRIPKECEQWHLSKLLKLIDVFSVKNQPEKKMPRREALSRQAALNKARRAKLRTKG